MGFLLPPLEGSVLLFFPGHHPRSAPPKAWNPQPTCPLRGIPDHWLRLLLLWVELSPQPCIRMLGTVDGGGRHGHTEHSAGPTPTPQPGAHSGAEAKEPAPDQPCCRKAALSPRLPSSGLGALCPGTLLGAEENARSPGWLGEWGHRSWARGTYLVQGFSAPAPHPDQGDPHHRQGLPGTRGCGEGRSHGAAASAPPGQLPSPFVTSPLGTPRWG